MIANDRHTMLIRKTAEMLKKNAVRGGYNSEVRR